MGLRTNFVWLMQALLLIGCQQGSDFGASRPLEENHELAAKDESQLSQSSSDQIGEESVESTTESSAEEISEEPSIPQNVSGSYLRSHISTEGNQLILRTTLIDAITNQPVILGDTETLVWEWDMQLGNPTRLDSQPNSLLLSYEQTTAELAASLEKMNIKAIWRSAGGLEHQISGPVLESMLETTRTAPAFSLIQSNSSVTMAISATITEGQYLIVRISDGDMSFYPENGVSYVPVSGTSGPVYLGPSPSFFEDNMVSGAHHSYYVWHQKPDLSYQLLGKWRTYTGSVTNETFVETDFSHHSLQYVEFRRSLFTAVTFRAADLQYAQFRGADLIEVDFSNADLRFADFSDASLVDVNFEGANLSGALWIDGNKVCAPQSIGQCL